MAIKDIYYHCENDPFYHPEWHWITDNIALGSYPLNPVIHELLDAGITAIASVREAQPDYDLSRFQDVHVLSVDDAAAFPYEALAGVLRFMHRVLEKGGKVYVHCFAGISRSSFVVSCYLMLRDNIPFEVAVRRVQDIRSKCYPHPRLYEHGVVDQLLANRDRILAPEPETAA